jgi:vacuolar protein sorting-associated protein 11
MQINHKIKEKQVMEFMQLHDASYDVNQALVVCQLYNFKAGILFLYEKNEMYQRILQYHMDNNDYENIINTCKKHYTKDYNLWIQALQYFSKREDFKCKEYIMQTIGYIDKHNLLPPLMVIKILSQNNTITLDSVKVSGSSCSCGSANARWSYF